MSSTVGSTVIVAPNSLPANDVRPRIHRHDVTARDPRAHHRGKADRTGPIDDDRIVGIDPKRVEHGANPRLHTAAERCGQRGIDGFSQHDGVGGARQRVGGEGGLPEEAATQGFSAQPKRARPVGPVAHVQGGDSAQ
jgi:hypothetical protein